MLSEGGKEENNENNLKYLLMIVVYFLDKSNYFIYSFFQNFLMKYSLFKHTLSKREENLFKEELINYTDKEWNIYFPCKSLTSITSLSSIPLSFSDKGKIKKEGNMIIQTSESFYESCVFDFEMKKVYL